MTSLETMITTRLLCRLAVVALALTSAGCTQDPVRPDEWLRTHAAPPVSPEAPPPTVQPRVTGFATFMRTMQIGTSTITISYRLDQRSRVKLDIIDLLGKRVITLVDQMQDEGEQRREWNGMTETGGPASGGIYLYVLTVEPANGAVETGARVRSERRKLLLVR